MKGIAGAAGALILVGVTYFLRLSTPPTDIRPAAAEPRVVISKKARELALYDGTVLRNKYPIALAANVPGAKQREGDRRTPEGTFYVSTRNGASRFHKFLGLSCPGPSDATRGLTSGQISRAEHDALLEAHRTRSCPPWKTELGGEVGIHGGGSDRDWTLGCIALTDDAIGVLWAVLRLGHPGVINP